MTLEGRAMVGSKFQFQLGATIQKSRYDDARKWSDTEDNDIVATKKMMRTPDVYGYFVSTWTPTKRLNMSLSGTYTGTMLVPHEAGAVENVGNKTEESPSFFDANYKIGYEFPLYKETTIELNAGVKNIFDAYQKDFDKGPNRASSYIYGPAIPRSFFVGAKISI